MDTIDEQDRAFHNTLTSFYDTLEKLVLYSVREPRRKHMAHFEQWFTKTFDTARDDVVIDETIEWWREYSHSNETRKASSLLFLELKTFNETVKPELQKLNPGNHRNSIESPPEKGKSTRGRNTKRKDFLNAGSTALGSILDAMGDLFPQIRGILKSAQEVVDVARG